MPRNSHIGFDDHRNESFGTCLLDVFGCLELLQVSTPLSKSVTLSLASAICTIRSRLLHLIGFFRQR